MWWCAVSAELAVHKRRVDLAGRESGHPYAAALRGATVAS
jgi:hypothetical protein